MRDFVDSTDIVADGDALAERMARDGYLFIRGLVPAAAVAEAGRVFAEIVAEAGWLLPGTPIGDRIADPDRACFDPQPHFLEVYSRFYRLQITHALKRHPAIIGFLERLLGGEVLAHPLHVISNVFPGREAFTTRPHQDYVHIQGTPETYTVWLPLHDCPREMGGLAIAEASHLDGVRDFAVCSGAGGLEVIEPFEGQWRSGDFKLGDALVFHSMNVHKSLDNRSDSIRHSMDPRYQRADQPILEVSMRPYSGCGGWDEIYADWASDELKYYWRRQDPTVEAFDWQYYERRDEMAFALAEQGDETARATLMRIVQRDPTPEKQARASSVLATLDRHAAGA